MPFIDSRMIRPISHITTTAPQYLTWALFIGFTCLHLFANYKAVTSLVFETFNDRRARMVVSTFIDTGTLLTPHDLAAREPIFDCKTW